VPIAIELSPQSLFMDRDRKIAAWQVFRAGMTAIYTTYVTPAFPSALKPAFESVYPSSKTGLLSTMATPSINTYTQRCNLADMHISLPEVVTTFSLVSNLAEMRGLAGLSVPGANVSLVANIVNIIAPDDGSVPTLIVANEAYPTFRLVCDAFHGALFVTNVGADAAQLIANGLFYDRKIGASSRYVAISTGNVYEPPSTTRLQSISSPLSCMLTGAEGLISAWQAAAPCGGITLITRLADWVASMIPSDCTNTDLALVRLDALYLARAAQQLAVGTHQVPCLTYQAYQPLVAAIRNVSVTISQTIASYQDQILQRKIGEQLVKDLQQVNQNVVDTGKLLTAYIQACQEQQQDLTAQYQNIVAADQSALIETVKSIDQLQRGVDDQRSAVQTAVEQYVVAIDHQALDEIVTTSFKIVESIFKLGFSMAPGDVEEDAKMLAKITNGIQKMLAVFAAVQKLAQVVHCGTENIAAADAAMSEIALAPSPSLVPLTGMSSACA
jgi:hypothetical protein